MTDSSCSGSMYFASQLQQERNSTHTVNHKICKLDPKCSLNFIPATHETMIVSGIPMRPRVFSPRRPPKAMAPERQAK